MTHPPNTHPLVAHRPMLFGLAYRMLGSVHDAEDVLQDAYLRWAATGRDDVAEPRRYLSRVVARLALDRLRARRAEPYIGPWLPEPLPESQPADPQSIHDSLSIATLHLMERLTPRERAVYVLRTAFDLPYNEIAPVVERSPEHCRQILHRARSRLDSHTTAKRADPQAHRLLLDAFLRAARAGDLAGLRQILHADAVAWTDGGGAVSAARRPIHGADRVARFFAGIFGRASRFEVRSVTVNGTPGAMVVRGRRRDLLTLSTTGDTIAVVHVLSNPAKLMVFDAPRRLSYPASGA